jgi:hypothetical protein
MNIGRLRFQVDAHSCNAPNPYKHVVDIFELARYMEIVSKYKISETQTPTSEYPIEYPSGIGDSCRTLPRHIQRLVGNIPEMDVPSGWENDEERDTIVATDGCVVFLRGCHSWIVATNNENLLLSGVGPGGGDQLLMMSYISELGGIVSGLAVIGTLVRSGKIKVKSVKLVCENKAGVKACKINRTKSMFHIT